MNDYRNRQISQLSVTQWPSPDRERNWKMGGGRRMLIKWLHGSQGVMGFDAGRSLLVFEVELGTMCDRYKGMQRVSEACR
jgi:hypothetical protein